MFETERIPNFTTPHYRGALLTAEKKLSERSMSGLKVVLGESNRQFIQNFRSERSTVYQGVAYSATTITLDQDLVKKAFAAMNGREPRLLKKEGQIGGGDPKKVVIFTFQALAPDITDHAGNSEDMLYDRVVRSLPIIARAMRNGEEAPEVVIHALGNPKGIGGQVTQELINDMKSEGFAPYGKMYQEYVTKHLPEKLDNIKVILQGVSRGAVTAALTRRYLSPAVQKVTQVLMDNPIGYHKRLTALFKGAQVGLGTVIEGEIIRRKDPLLKICNEYKEENTRNLSEYIHATEDSPEQTALKKSMANNELLKITIGGGTDIKIEENRYYMRRALFDPLSYSPRNHVKALFEKIKNSINNKVGAINSFPIQRDGKSLVGSYYGTHFYSPYRRFDRWETILNYCASIDAV
jgi:hypothetical protein